MLRNVRKSMHLIDVSVSMSDGLKLSISFFLYTFFEKDSVILFLLRFVVFLNFIVIFGIMVTDYLFFYHNETLNLKKTTGH